MAEHLAGAYRYKGASEEQIDRMPIRVMVELAVSNYVGYPICPAAARRNRS
jgi:hypothetical protein